MGSASKKSEKKGDISEIGTQNGKNLKEALFTCFVRVLLTFGKKRVLSTFSVF